MSEVETLFRFCPSCGKRFHVRLVSKKLIDAKEETLEAKQVARGGNANPMTYIRGTYPIVLEENVPVTIIVEDFQYSYKCKHCGHEWTETQVTQKKA
jgi:transposase-like protein